jgi:quercetin dioxygenase-like cupin family protein
VHHLPTATTEPDESTPGCRSWRVSDDVRGDRDFVAVREMNLGFTEHVVADPSLERAFVVLSGQLTMRTSSGEHQTRARSVLFLPRGVHCQLSVSEPTRVLWIASTTPAEVPPGGASVDLALTSIDDSEAVVTTEPAMGLLDVATRQLIPSDTIPTCAVLVGHSRFASPEGSHELHRHERGEFLYVMSGTPCALSEEGESALNAGDLLYIPGGEWHGLRAMEREDPSEHIFGYLGAASFAEAGYAVRG